jgi:type IV pilus assembly protein PilO
MADLKIIGESISAQFRGLKGRHPGQWPLVPRLACAAAVVVGVVAFGWFFYWDSQLDQLAAGAQEEIKLRDAYKSKLQQAINLDGLRKQKLEVGEYVSTLEKQLPNKAEMDALLSDINQAGVGRGLQFELFKPGQVVVKEYYAELPINIKISGGYHEVGSFTSDIANLPRIVTLNNMNLVAGKDGVLTLEAIAKTFRYLDVEEVASQRKAAAGKAAEAKGAKK